MQCLNLISVCRGAAGWRKSQGLALFHTKFLYHDVHRTKFLNESMLMVSVKVYVCTLYKGHVSMLSVKGHQNGKNN